MAWREGVPPIPGPGAEPPMGAEIVPPLNAAPVALLPVIEVPIQAVQFVKLPEAKSRFVGICAWSLALNAQSTAVSKRKNRVAGIRIR